MSLFYINICKSPTLRNGEENDINRPPLFSDPFFLPSMQLFLAMVRRHALAAAPPPHTSLRKAPQIGTPRGVDGRRLFCGSSGSSGSGGGGRNKFHTVNWRNKKVFSITSRPEKIGKFCFIGKISKMGHFPIFETLLWTFHSCVILKPRSGSHSSFVFDVSSSTTTSTFTFTLKPQWKP